VAVVLIQQRQDQYLRAAALQFPPKCIEAPHPILDGMSASALSLVSAVRAMA